MDFNNINYAQAREMLNKLEGDIGKLKAEGNNPVLVEKITQEVTKLQGIMDNLYQTTKLPMPSTADVQTPYIGESEIHIARQPDAELAPPPEIEQMTIDSTPPSIPTLLFIHVAPFSEYNRLCFNSLVQNHPKAFQDCEDYHFEFVPNPADASFVMIPLDANRILKLEPDQMEKHILNLREKLPKSVAQNTLLTLVGDEHQILKMKPLMLDYISHTRNFPSGFIVHNAKVPFVAFYITDPLPRCDEFDCSMSREIYEKARGVNKFI